MSNILKLKPKVWDFLLVVEFRSGAWDNNNAFAAEKCKAKYYTLLDNATHVYSTLKLGQSPQSSSEFKNSAYLKYQL